MNLLATLLGGSVAIGGAVALGVATAPKPGDRYELPPGTLACLTYAASRALSTYEAQALLWSFQDNFPGTIEGFALADPTTVKMNVAMNSPSALVIGMVGAFDDIVLQLTDVEVYEGASKPEQAPTQGTTYA